MAKYFVDPISRIEGHLGVNLTAPTGGGTVTEADVHGNLWRGFENFLIGREPNDAITFTQRICGVCPVPHGQTSTYTVEAAIGYNDNFQTFSTATDSKGVPVKAMLMRNMILGMEFLMSSMTHFYHLAAPSYIQGPNVPPWTPYFADSYYHQYLRSNGKGTGDLTGSGSGGTLPADGANGFSKDLWSAVIKQYVKALRIRRLTFEAGAMFAGRMPMSSGLIAGGTGVNKNEDLTAKIAQFNDLLAEITDFVTKEYVPVVLALGALYPNYDNYANASTSAAVVPNLWQVAGNASAAPAADGSDTGYGAGVGNFLAWGGFPQMDGTLYMPRGFKLKAAIGTAGAGTAISVADVQANLREHVTHSRYDETSAAATAAGYDGSGISNPLVVNRTIPVRDASTDATGTGKYSWLKAPRWNGNPMEVGPMARLYVAGQFVSGSALAGTVTGYTGYVKSYTGTGNVSNYGLKPSMVGADLAVTLVQNGLAELRDATTGTVVSLAGLTHDQIAAAYNETKVITGIILAWVVNLKAGLSTMDRLRGRAIESLQMCGALAAWSAQLSTNKVGDTFRPVAVPTTQKSGFGATEAPRGALMHAVTIDKGKIVQYQCIVPTTWNGSPKDKNGTRGPIEQAMIGIPYVAGGGGKTIRNQANTADIPTEGGVEALRVAQSFDPCIACAVH